MAKGLLNANQNLSDPLLAQVEAKLEANLSPAQKNDYLKIVTAGMRIALNKGPAGLMGTLTKSKNPLQDIVNGAIGIIGIMRRQSVGTMPVGEMLHAGMTLILHGLDFAEKAKIMPPITTDVIDQATQLYINTILPKLGITPDHMQAMMQSAQSTISDPAKLAAVKQQAAGTFGDQSGQPGSQQ